MELRIEEEKSGDISNFYDKEELLGEQGAGNGPLGSQRVGVENELGLLGEQDAGNVPQSSRRVVVGENEMKATEEKEE